MGPLLAAARAGDLWIGDRNFCTRPILCGWHQQGSSFLVREHGANPNPRERDKPRMIGKIDTDTVFEQVVSIDDDSGSPVLLRRIELRLNKPTEDGETIIRLLTNLPASEFSSLALARLYRRRWRIEMMFQRLESVLQSEIPALGHPRAAAGTSTPNAFGGAAENQMIYLLDTNVCIQLLNEKHKVILQHFRRHVPADIALRSVVKAELLYGARRSQRVAANLQ